MLGPSRDISIEQGRSVIFPQLDFGSSNINDNGNGDTITRLIAEMREAAREDRQFVEADVLSLLTFCGGTFR